jgi:hypothetical protein
LRVEGLMGTSPDTFLDALSEAWTPGAEVSRYRRTWRLAAARVVGEGRLAGRIGFTREGGLETVAWDDEVKDFKKGEASGGVVVPFVVDLSRQRVSYQLVSGQVRPTSFTGALEGALNEASPYDWTVTPLVQHLAYGEWLAEIDVVTKAKFVLKRPNPHYANRKDVQHLIEGLKAQVATVTVKGENLDTDDDLFQEYLDHVEQNYGNARLSGRTRAGEPRTWFSDGGGSVPAVLPVQVDENASEVDDEQLVEVLDEVGETSEVGRDEDFDDDDEA